MRKMSAPFLALIGSLVYIAGCSQEASFQPGQAARQPLAEASSIRAPGDNPEMWMERFNAGVYQDTTLEFPNDFANAQQTITLVQPMTDGTQEFLQATRSVYRDEFRQGGGNNSALERFQQNELGVLDVLLIVDNSNSMRQEQENLAARLAPLISSINNTNWRIAITSTDPKDGCVVRVIARNDQNQDQMFSEAILGLGTAGARNEVGFYQARAAINCGNPQWRRAQANLAVIFVSDEDNCGRGNECGDYPESQSVAYLTSEIAKTHTLGQDAKIHGIVWEPGTTCNVGGFEANLYAEAVRQSKGKIGSICDNDYTPILTEISKDMQATLKTQVQLQNVPITSTLKVMVNGQDYTAYVKLADRTLTFSKAPPAGAVIEVIYQHMNGALLNEFELPRDRVDESTLVVNVNGQTMDAASYTYNVQTRRVIFSSMPAANAQIVVEYKRQEKRWSDLVLTKSIAPDTLKVTVNGQVTTDFVYDTSVKKVVFKTPPPDGARVVMTYKGLEEPVLTYPFAAEFVDVNNVRAVWQDAPDQIAPITYHNKTISIDRAAFKRGRVLIVQYQNAVSTGGTITLPQLPDGTYTLDIDSADCQPADIVIHGRTMTANCKLIAGEHVTVSYRYLAEIRQTFAVPEFAADTNYLWQVYVNDQEITDFTRADGKVTVQRILSPSDVITIRATKRNL